MIKTFEFTELDVTILKGLQAMEYHWICDEDSSFNCDYNFEKWGLTKWNMACITKPRKLVDEKMWLDDYGGRPIINLKPIASWEDEFPISIDELLNNLKDKGEGKYESYIVIPHT